MDREIEVMRVLRVPPMGKLVAEFRERRYTHLQEIQEKKIQQLLLAAIGELVDFAGGYQKLVDAGVAPPLQDSVAPDRIKPLEEKRAEFIASLEAEQEKMRGTSGSRSRRTPFTGRGADQPPQMIPLIEQIDAILQKHVTTDPALSTHSIHLKQNPKGGLQIEVDGQIYERPRDIDDKRIQIAIKAALREWETT